MADKLQYDREVSQVYDLRAFVAAVQDEVGRDADFILGLFKMCFEYEGLIPSFPTEDEEES